MKFSRVCWVVLMIAVMSVGSLSAADGVRPFAVTVTGSGKPMILIPGLACDGSVWDGTVAHYKDRYECHVVTLAGFAGQPAIEGLTLEKVSEGLIAYLHEKGLVRPVIVGHSLGGFLAFGLGAAVPGEVGPIVAVDGVPYFPALREAGATPEQTKAFAEMMRMGMARQTPEQFAQANRGILAGMITDPGELERMAESSGKSDPKAVAQAFYELMTTDLRPKVAAIKVPVLLLGATASVTDAGERAKSEEKYRAQVATIPKHTVIFAPKAKHFIQLDEPEFFFQQVDAFLKEGLEAGQ